MSLIEVKGASEHNLKDVSLDIPKQKLVAFTGVSGSGKSSLVFDTLYVEAFRRFADANHAPIHMMGHSMWARTKRPKFKSIRGLPPALGLSQRQGVAGKLSTVGTISGASDLLRVYFAAFGDVFCKNCDIPLKKTTFQQLFKTVCEDYKGQKVFVVAPIVEKRKGGFATEIQKFRDLGFSKIRINGNLFSLQDDDLPKVDAKKLNTIEVMIDFLAVEETKHKRLERAIVQALEFGKGVVVIEIPEKKISNKFNTSSACPQCGESAPRLDPRYFSHSALGQCTKCLGTGSRLEDAPADLYPCSSCNGCRLSKDRPIVRVGGRTFEQVHGEGLVEILKYLKDVIVPLSEAEKSRKKVSEELLRILTTLVELDLTHLQLGRSGSSLSPGDLQRLRLAGMISNRLSGALYVLDEPCQCLTDGEVAQVLKVLRKLVDAGSSVVCVEHHPSFLKGCDEIFLMGPGAGVKGGQVVGKENPSAFAKDHSSLQANQKKTVKAGASISSKEKSGLMFKEIQVRNLQKKSLFVPSGAITLLRGRAGVGKSSFLELCLMPALLQMSEQKRDSKVDSLKLDHCLFEMVGGAKVSSLNDVRPGSMTRSSRKSVASAMEILQPLRLLFSMIPQSQILGLTESHFSFFSKQGRCPDCEGRGYNEIQQRYGAPVEVPCELCSGARLSSTSLLPRFKGLNFAEIMELSVEEARDLFSHVKHLEPKLSRAVQFGLGYVKVGQGMDSLSGGELQRLTLTIELKRSQLEGSWFVLVHPGTGLHSPDIVRLGELMQLMKHRGASFFMLENREEFFAYSDHILEF